MSTADSTVLKSVHVLLAASRSHHCTVTVWLRFSYCHSWIFEVLPNISESRSIYSSMMQDSVVDMASPLASPSSHHDSINVCVGP